VSLVCTDPQARLAAMDLRRSLFRTDATIC
jgi:hypothetical protein